HSLGVCLQRLFRYQFQQRFFQIKENIECEIFGSLLEEARDSYKEEIIHELQSETVDQMHANMCQMWQRIRYGVRWKPAERLALAARALDMKSVKSVDISLDPFCCTVHPRNGVDLGVLPFRICVLWFTLQVKGSRVNEPNCSKVSAEVRNDRQPPFFIATLDNGKKLLFKTDNMPAMDLIMRFNKLLGNPELGKSGTRPRQKL
ncbi:hypothetical protein COOONC_24539, partial [Cooperia oncophora]